MQRYFTNQKEKDVFLLSKEDSYHITKVMRMNIDDKIEVVYEENVYICKLSNLSGQVSAKIEEISDEVNELNLSVTLVQSLTKEQKMDYILQKTTELGVYKIYPYTAQRSVVKVNSKKDNKLERWQRIVKEASEQSKRNKIPVVEDVITLDSLCKLEGYTHKFIATVNEKTKNLKKVLSNVKSYDTIIIVVGPEGGFTTNEESKLMENGFVPISLGKSVLRTETAGLFILSVIRYIDME